MTVLCFPNSSLCVDLPLDNVTLPTNISSILALVPGQAPFTGFGSLWLIGVVISSVIILTLIVWTAAQTRIREVMRKRRNVEPDTKVMGRQMDKGKDRSQMSAEFAMSSVFVSSLTGESHLASLKKANPNSEQLSIEFENLSLVLLNGHGKTVLSNINGVLFPGSMTAILGPSGSGKTSLLTAVAGRANYGKMTGTVRVNGVEQPIAKFRTVVGFVPQEDVMIRTLTVRQILMFSARMRLPYSLSERDKANVVDGVLKVLGLENVQNQMIGDETFRGISGGQRKRVNIGIELVSAPLALFLDEPTSGLDSTSAFEAVSSLLSLMPLNINVAAVVHQPREEIFNLFDRLVLLSNGGRTVFSGKRVLVVPYFERLGFVFDRAANPADQVLDIISGRQMATDGSAHDFADLWESFSMHERQRQRLPSIDEQSLANFEYVLRQRRAKAAESNRAFDMEASDEFSPMHEMFHHSESARNKVVKAVIACSISFLGCIACIVLLCMHYSQPIFLRVIVPFCSIALAVFVATIIFIIVKACTSDSVDLMEKCCFFAAGSVFGPLAVLLGVIWQNTKQSRFYLFWLYLCAGFGAWTLIMCSAFGTAMAMRANNYSEQWNFTTDVAVCWLLFVCAPFGFVVLIACIMRIFRRTNSSVRQLAPFFVQIKHQIVRSVQEAWVQPAGILLDMLLAAISGTMIGLTTSGRWAAPYLEILAALTENTPFPIKACLPQLPNIACLFISNPQSDPLFSNALFIPLALGLIGVISSLRFFGSNKANFQRENLASLSTTAVFVAKSLLVIATTCITSAVFLSFWGLFVQPTAAPGLYYLFILVSLFSATSLGFLVSICLRVELAGMIGIVLILIFTLFSTTLSGVGPFQMVVSYFSINNWGSVTFYTMSVEPYNATRTTWMTNVYGFSPGMQSFAWNQLFCLGVFMRLLGWLALVYKEV